MITGKVIINDVDVKSTYGAYVIEGGFVDIPSIPDMKEPAINDWYEYDGVEADLESPCCEPLIHTVVFMMNGELDALDSFMKLIKSDRFVSFYMVDIARQLNVRIVSAIAEGIAIGLYRITVVLSEDNPLENVEYIAPENKKTPTGLTIDGNDISMYGMSIVDSLDWLYPGVDIKENLLHSSQYDNGESHYTGNDMDVTGDEVNDMPVTCNANDIEISAIMTSKSFNQFWVKRNALALDLFRPNERVIAYKGVSKKAYYKSCRSSSFMYSGKIWWKFKLSFGYLGGE